ncbi:hypothetical protein [Jiangella alkaliphila]|uniref:Uncharacterized protein n=1 Tax=Jiangella alkaliphila TaxID=419479 RepID=A0A1H2JIV6_9ACTN|nr:hypothetical protein [Jiangella alkaliphila]SDU56081.1 hypothetical protein SAMN04488563_2726 [Jiangella alkaliphila]
MSDDIPNPYLAALRDARIDADRLAGHMRDHLKDVKTAMDNGAWVSTTADEFYTALGQQNTALDTTADEAVAEVDDAIRGRPEMVPPDSPDGRWTP